MNIKWVILFLIFPFLKPHAIELLWPDLEVFFNTWRVFNALVLIVVCIIKGRLPSKPIWTVAGIEVIIILSTYINGGDLLKPVLNSAVVLCMATVIDFFSQYPRSMILAFLMDLELLIYSHLLSILLGRSNIASNFSHTDYFFLGHRNGFYGFALLAIVVGLLYKRIEKKRFRPYCLIIVCYACVVLAWSATTLSALTITILLLLVFRRVKGLLTFPKIFFAAMTINLLISVFRIMDHVSWIAWLIENILKKQITLTGRTFIWDQCYKLIAAHPFRGYGFGSHLIDVYYPVTAHNEYLELLIEGGVFALAFFLILNYQVGKKLIQYQNSPIAYIFLSMLAGLYIIFITECSNGYLNYALLMFAYHIDKFESACIPRTVSASPTQIRKYRVRIRKFHIKI